MINAFALHFPPLFRIVPGVLVSASALDLAIDVSRHTL